MNKYFVLVLLLFCFSCKNKKEPTTENKPVSAKDFFARFSKLKLPYNAADTSLSAIGDTSTFAYETVLQFIPDSALTFLLSKQKKPIQFYPVGKIENKFETYLLIKATSGKTASLSAFLFDNKKNFVNHLPLISNKNDDGYIHSVDINTEPTFVISQDKTVNDQYSFTKHGYAYNTPTKSFIEVINASNEAERKADIINPIDTLKKMFPFSGDYTKDKMNFISIRDGNLTGRYTFFIHFEKSQDDCTGELKGTMTLVSANKAVFQQSGDPCVVDFTFDKNVVKVKERGSCGNHRGITCLFDDSYKKKEVRKPPTTKANKKKR